MGLNRPNHISRKDVIRSIAKGSLKYASTKKGRSERLYGAIAPKRNVFPGHISEEHSGTEDNNTGNMTLPEIKKRPIVPTLLLNGEAERKLGGRFADGLGGDHNRSFATKSVKKVIGSNRGLSSDVFAHNLSKHTPHEMSISTDLYGQDEDKIVEINEYLKTKVDLSKLNVRMFQ